MAISANEILGWNSQKARQVWGRSPADIRKGFKALAAAWHPDVCHDPQAARVLAHLVSLRKMALGESDRDLVRFSLASGGALGMRCLSQWSSETGGVYVGPRTVGLRFEPGLEDLAQAAQERWKGWRFADARMKTYFAPLVPSKVLRAEALTDGGTLLVIARPDGYVAFGDLLAHLDGGMAPEDVAWLGSRLFNLVAWFQWMGLAHGALQGCNVFVNPRTHGVAVLGGWEFATALGERPAALPGATLRAVPRLEAAGERVDGSTDLVLVRAILRTALGPKVRVGPVPQGLPVALNRFLMGVPATDARAELAVWDGVLRESWGKRAFHECPAREADIYAL